MKFWSLWGFDALIAAVVVYFFLVGLADGSVSSFNAGLWTVLLVVLAGVVGGGLALRAKGYPKGAVALLLLLAIPGLLFCAFFLLLIVTHPRWN